MNRKMRAKLNNQQARRAKERKTCPDAGKLLATSQTNCDRCGDDLLPVAVLMLEQSVDKKHLH